MEKRNSEDYRDAREYNNDVHSTFTNVEYVNWQKACQLYTTCGSVLGQVVGEMVSHLHAQIKAEIGSNTHCQSRCNSEKIVKRNSSSQNGSIWRIDCKICQKWINKMTSYHKNEAGIQWSGVNMQLLDSQPLEVGKVYMGEIPATHNELQGARHREFRPDVANYLEYLSNCQFFHERNEVTIDIGVLMAIRDALQMRKWLLRRPDMKIESSDLYAIDSLLGDVMEKLKQHSEGYVRQRKEILQYRPPVPATGRTDQQESGVMSERRYINWQALCRILIDLKVTMQPNILTADIKLTTKLERKMKQLEDIKTILYENQSIHETTFEEVDQFYNNQIRSAVETLGSRFRHDDWLKYKYINDIIKDKHEDGGYYMLCKATHMDGVIVDNVYVTEVQFLSDFFFHLSKCLNSRSREDIVEIVVRQKPGVEWIMEMLTTKPTMWMKVDEALHNLQKQKKKDDKKEKKKKKKKEKKVKKKKEGDSDTTEDGSEAEDTFYTLKSIAARWEEISNGAVYNQREAEEYHEIAASRSERW